MRPKYILISVLVIGALVTAFVWFFIKTSPAPDTTGDTSPRAFFSFFGRQLGFGGDTITPTSTPTTSVDTVRPTFRAMLARERMIRISDEMLAGATFTATTTASSTYHYARFVERETGNIKDFSLETGLTTRITNTTIPRIHEAAWGRNGSSVALRYLADDNETIETYVAPLPMAGATTTVELSGTFFQQNIASVSMSPGRNELFYLTTTNTGATGRVSNLSGGDVRIVFFSPLREWLSVWASNDTIGLFTKPSNGVSSYSYAVDSENGQETPLLGSARALTLLPNPSFTQILYSESLQDSTRLFWYDRGTRESKEFLLSGLPEKCVWVDDDRVICAIPSAMPEGMPDLWYQGRVSLSDVFWLLDTVSGQAEFLFAPESTPAGESIDAIDLSLSADKSVIAFINKKDLVGWVADVSEINN